MAIRWKEQQRKNRIKRREYMFKYREEELQKMGPDERQAYLDKDQKRRERRIIKEQDLYEQVLAYQGRNYMPKDEEFFLRKMIRKDVKKILYLEDLEDGDEDAVDPDQERRIEERVQYGTDSESEFDITDPLQNYVIGEEDAQEYSQSDEGQAYGEEDPNSNFEFDDGEEEKSEVDSSVDLSGQTPLNESTDPLNTSGSSTDRTPRGGQEIEMVDLRKQAKKDEYKMREFEVPGKVNQSKKKREKRKAKKEQEQMQSLIE